MVWRKDTRPTGGRVMRGFCAIAGARSLPLHAMIEAFWERWDAAA